MPRPEKAVMHVKYRPSYESAKHVFRRFRKKARVAQ